MTAQIAIFNLSGVAVATDSTTTVSNDERSRTFSGAQKLFDLGENHRVVAMISGEARFMQVPYGVLLPIWRDSLTQALPTVRDYAADFAAWLPAQSTLFDTDQQRGMWGWLLEDCYLQIRSTLRGELIGRRLDAAPWDDLSVAAVVTEIVRDEIDDLKDLDDLDDTNPQRDQDFVDAHAESIQKAFDDVFDETPRTLGTDELLLRELPLLILRKWARWATNSTVAFIGYGADDIFPAHQTMDLIGIVDGRLRYSMREIASTSLRTQSIVAPFAQSEAIHTFLRAYNHEFLSIAHRRLTGTIDAISELDGLADDQIESIQELGREAHKELTDDVDDYSWREFVSPMLTTVEALPHSDLARMAEALVGIQALRSHSSDRQPSVGGTIALLTISPESGVTWLRRHADPFTP